MRDSEAKDKLLEMVTGIIDENPVTDPIALSFEVTFEPIGNGKVRWTCSCGEDLVSGTETGTYRPLTAAEAQLKKFLVEKCLEACKPKEIND